MGRAGDVIKSVIVEIGFDIDTLSMHSMLCNTGAAYVAAKYDLHGSVDKAIEKLKEIRQLFVDNKYTIQMVSDINKRSDRYDALIANDPYTKEIHEAYANGNQRKISVMQERQNIKIKEIHDKKECICYN